MVSVSKTPGRDQISPSSNTETGVMANGVRNGHTRNKTLMSLYVDHRKSSQGLNYVTATGVRNGHTINKTLMSLYLDHRKSMLARGLTM